MTFGLCYGLDVDLQVANGKITLSNLIVIDNGFSAKITNHSTEWTEVVVHLEMSGHCEGKPATWSGDLIASVGYLAEAPISRNVSDWLVNMKGRGCQAEDIKATLVSAQNYVTVQRKAAEKLREENAASVAARAEEEARAAQLAAEKEALLAEVEEVRLARFPVLKNQMAAVFVASDIKCSQEYQAAIKLGGLEQRKKLTELISYKCGFAVENGVHVRVVSRSGGYAHVQVEEGEKRGDDGFVLESWVIVPRDSTPTSGKGAKR